MADVFISYSRKDKEFVHRLQETLTEHQRQAWLDTKDIPPTAEWLQEIYAAIEKADAFVFVISPESSRSDVCQLELAHAVKHHKRLIPLLRRMADPPQVPDPLPHLNWLFFREEDDFAAGFQTFLTALGTDLDWVKAHTRLLTRAIEWSGKGRDRSGLLRGSDLRQAEAWLAQSGNKEPKPTELQGQFILASRQGETRRKRQIMGALGIGIVALVIAAMVAFYQYLESDKRGRIALSRQLAAQSRNLQASKPDLALILSVEANRVAGEILGSASFLQGLLQKAVRGISQENQSITEPEQALFAALTLPPHRVRFFHRTGSVMAFSPDGKQFVFLDGNKDLVVYDLVKGQSVSQRLTGVDDIADMALSANGQVLALRMSKDKRKIDASRYVFWDMASGQTRGPILDLQHSKVAFSPNGKLFAVKKNGVGRVEIWNFGNLKMLYALGIPEKSVEPFRDDSLVFNQDARTLFLWYQAGEDYKGIRWDLTTRQPMHLTCNKGGLFPDQAMSPDGKSLALVERDGALAFYNLSSGQQIGRTPLRYSFSRELVFSPDGKTLSLFEHEHHGTAVDPPVLEKDFIITYDVLTQKEVGRFLTDTFFSGFTSSPDGKILAANGGSGIHLWDVPHLRPLRPPLHHPEVEKFSFCPDSEHIASMDGEGNIILWKLTGDPLGRILSSPVHGVGSFAFSPCSRKLAVATGRTLEIWQLAGIPPSSVTVTCRKDEKTKKIERLDDSQQIETGDDDHRPEGFHSLAFNPNGETLAVADPDGDVYIWDVKHGKQISETLSTGEPMIALAFDSEGKTLAASTVFRYSQTEDMEEEQIVSLWDVSRGESLRKLPGHKGMATCMAFSPDGRLLASGDYAGNLFLWEVSTGIKQQPALNRGRNESPYLNSLAFSPDGKLLAYGRHNDIILWEVVKEPQGGTGLNLGKTLAGKDAGIIKPFIDLSFSPDGKTLAAKNFDGTVILWDVSTGTAIGSTFSEVYKPKTGKMSVGRQISYRKTFIAYSPDGKKLAFADKGKVILYEADLQSWKNKARSIANRDLTPKERETYLGK
jgi:WD40 repeat protein